MLPLFSRICLDECYSVFRWHQRFSSVGSVMQHKTFFQNKSFFYFKLKLFHCLDFTLVKLIRMTYFPLLCSFIQKIQRARFHYKKVKKGTPNLTPPPSYVYSLFIIALIKQTFEKRSHRGQRLKLVLSFSLK